MRVVTDLACARFLKKAGREAILAMARHRGTTRCLPLARLSLTRLVKLTRVYQALFRAYTGLPRRLGSSWSPFPLEVSISITHRCNLNCSFCLVRNQLNGGGDELSTAEWLRFIRGTPRPSMCVFAGGEPFLRQDFLEILEASMRLRKSLVITNGSVVPGDFARLAVRGRLLMTSFSLDGIGAVHDRLRCRPGCFDTVVANIERLQAEKARRGARLPLISISSVLLPSNLDQVASLASLAARLGADFITFSLHSPPIRCVPTLDAEKLKVAPPDVTGYDLGVMEEQFRRVEEMKLGVDMRFLPVFRDAGSMLEYLRHEDAGKLRKTFDSCGAPYGSVFVTPSGDVFPCRVFYPLGNVREHSLGSLWNSRAMRDFRRHACRQEILPSCIRCCRLMESSPSRNLSN